MIKRNLTLFLLFISSFSFSQFSNNLEVISAAGDYFAPEGKNINISFTIGEPMNETFSSLDKSIILTQGFQQPNISGIISIDGYVTYDNAIHSPMTNTLVFLINSELQKQDSSFTDISGHYAFKNVIDGVYTLKCFTNKAYGGEDPADALFVNWNYIGKYKFRNALVKKASDLNADKKTNPTDALFINKRFIKVIDSYKSGDWAFEIPSISVSDANVRQNIKALCYGDIDASYNVPNKKAESELILENEGVIIVSNANEFELPVAVTRDMYLGAMGLVIDYPSKYLKITDVISNPGMQNFMFNILDGQVRIAWSDITQDGHYVNNNSPLIKLKMIANNINNDKEILLSLSSESKLTDNTGKSLIGEILHSPRIAFETASSGFYLGQNFPNPFNNKTRIDYSLAESSNVSLKMYDLLGKEIAEPVNEYQISGYHHVYIDMTGLAEGVYTYKFTAEGATKKFTKTRMMIISK